MSTKENWFIDEIMSAETEYFASITFQSGLEININGRQISWKKEAGAVKQKSQARELVMYQGSFWWAVMRGMYRKVPAM